MPCSRRVSRHRLPAALQLPASGIACDTELLGDLRHAAGNDIGYPFIKRTRYDIVIGQLLIGNHGPELTEALRKALAEEVKPIAARLSKALYRYAIELDMLTQIVAYAEIPFDALDDIRREARLRVAQQRGRIDVNALLQEERTKQLLEDM